MEMKRYFFWLIPIAFFVFFQWQSLGREAKCLTENQKLKRELKNTQKKLGFLIWTIDQKVPPESGISVVKMDNGNINVGITTKDGTVVYEISGTQIKEIRNGKASTYY